MSTRPRFPFRHLVTLAAGAIALHSMHLGAQASPRAKTHRVIVVQMIRDSTGQHYRPSVIRAAIGDTLRFVNGPGRHNVHFLDDSAPAGAVVPAPTPELEHDGESVAIPVPLKPGKYFFQCDPHAAMGMVGHLIVRRRFHLAAAPSGSYDQPDRSPGYR